MQCCSYSENEEANADVHSRNKQRPRGTTGGVPAEVGEKTERRKREVKEEGRAGGGEEEWGRGKKED